MLVSHKKAALFFVLISSFIVQLLLTAIPGYKIDQNSFLFWYNHASGGNFSTFYNPPNWSDYPPFNVYIFWFFGSFFLKPAFFLLSHFSLSPPWTQLIPAAAIKLPAIMFNLALTALIFLFAKRRFPFRTALLTASLYAFNPAVIYDLAVWGQMDSVFSLLVTGSLLFLLDKKYELSSILLALGLLTKPQSVVLLPFLIYVLAREKRWLRFISCGLLSLLTILLIALPFSQGNPFGFLLAVYGKAYSVYPFDSINAYNFWAAAGGPGQFWQPDTQEFLSITWRNWGIILFLLFVFPVLWQLHRKFTEANLIFALFLLIFSFFLFMTRMHERYIFLALPVLSLILPAFRRLSWLYAALSLNFFATLAYILPVLNSDRFIPAGDISFYIFVPAYFLIFILAMMIFFRGRFS